MSKRLLNGSTLKDVAALASVSISTASRVLSGKTDARVSQETRFKIIQAAKELEYHPNALARSLKIKTTFTLALYIPDIANPVFPEIIEGVEQGANERGYSVFISHLNKQSIDQRLYLELLQERRVDGLIIATALIEDSVIKDLVAFNCPFVMLNRRAYTTNNYVVVDDVWGAKMAVDHLIELGHSRIAHLAGPLMFDTALRRLQGYRQSLAEHCLAYESALVEESGWSSWEEGKKGMKRLFLSGRRPTAVFAGNLMVAVGALASVREFGFKVPEDISIIGLHDAPLAEVIDPPLTVVKMPLFEMGRQAALALIDLLNDKPWTAPLVLPPTGLVIRKSTDRARVDMK